MANDYISAHAASPLDLEHYGVKGMKWGVRRDRDHGSSTSNVKRQGTGMKRGLVTDYTISPYRSVGRIKSGKTTFNDLNPKQKNKLEKSLARNMQKTFEKKFTKDRRGKIDYLNIVQQRPDVRDKLISEHGGLFRFAKRNPKITNRRQYLTTYSNYPRVLTLGSKTNSAVYTLGVSAALARGFSKHSDDVAPTDYIGVVLTDRQLEHYGVKGMKWGVRNASRGGKAKPTRAKVKEDKQRASAKAAEALTSRAEKIKAGTGRPLVVNGKALSREESVKYLERQAAKLGGKTKTTDKTADTKAETNVNQTQYNAIKRKALETGVKSLTDDELKYFNARNEAMAKAQKAFAEPDSWLRKTVGEAIKNAAKEQINAGAKKAAERASAKLLEKIVAEQAKKKAKTATPFPALPAATTS